MMVFPAPVGVATDRRPIPEIDSAELRVLKEGAEERLRGLRAAQWLAIDVLRFPKSREAYQALSRL